MSEKPTDYESMGCDELLREMARLTSERDRLQSQVGSSTTVPPAQQTQEQAMEREGDLLKRLGDLIVRKGCGGQLGATQDEKGPTTEDRPLVV